MTTILGFKARSTVCRKLENVVIWVTDSANGQAFLVAAVTGKHDVSKTAQVVYSAIAEVLQRKGMYIVHERVFGSLSTESVVRHERGIALRTGRIQADGPITCAEGRPPWGEGLAGIIIHAVSDNADDVWTIMDGENPCGRGWIRNGLTYLMLQNIQGQAETKPGQARRMFERAERLLRENGASYKNVVRTWFYLSEILDWYPDFNQARSEKYGEFGIMPGPGDTRLLLPASTGIGADTPSGAATSMDLLAVVENGDMTSLVRKLTNRKQLDAFRYGAAFSRGAVIKGDNVTLIQVSGTAAIDEHGKSLYPGDIRSQIDCTFDKIGTLLSQEGAELRDIAGATVFVKNPEYASLFWEMAAERGLAEFPAVCVVADVCREELLFEIDAEAVVRKGATCV